MVKVKILSAEDLRLRGLEEVKPGVYQKMKKPLQGDLISKEKSLRSELDLTHWKLQVLLEKEVATLNIKALSINGAFKGRRFKTEEYSAYEKLVLSCLPRIKLGTAPYELIITFGLSNKGNDLDNCLKPFIDCLVKKYDFDDRQIYSIVAKKEISKKGMEYIKFQLKSI